MKLRKLRKIAKTKEDKEERESPGVYFGAIILENG